MAHRHCLRNTRTHDGLSCHSSSRISQNFSVIVLFRNPFLRCRSLLLVSISAQNFVLFTTLWNLYVQLARKHRRTSEKQKEPPVTVCVVNRVGLLSHCLHRLYSRLLNGFSVFSFFSLSLLVRYVIISIKIFNRGWQTATNTIKGHKSIHKLNSERY